MSNIFTHHLPSGSGSFPIPISAPAEPGPLPPPRPPGVALRRHRPCRPIDLNALCPGESVTDVEILRGDGSAFVIVPSCLTSHRWTRPCIAAAVAEALDLPIDCFPGGRVQFFATPIGRIPMHRYVVLWFRPVTTDVFTLMVLPVLETETHGALGVSMVIGGPHLQNVVNPLGVPVPSFYVPPPPQHGENYADGVWWSAGAMDHQTVEAWLTDAYAFQEDDTEGQNPMG